MDIETVEKYWKSAETIKEIMVDRGYELREPKTFEDFLQDAKDKNIVDLKRSLKTTYDSDERGRTMIFWSLKPKLGTNIRDIVIEMEDNDCRKAIIIVDVSVTPNSKSIIRNLKTVKGISVHAYTLDDSCINISRHEYVPKHIVCSRREKREIMKSYALKPRQMPKILSSDPMVRHLGAEKGEVIRIIRDSEIMHDKKVVTYRMVV